MKSENFQEGFVQHCVDRGLNQFQTEALYKFAHLASAFDNENFRNAFDSKVIEKAASHNLTTIEKATLVEKAVAASYK